MIAMKKTILALVLLAAAFSAHARGALYGWAERGGYSALSSLNGSPVSIQRGCPAATITVRVAGTLTAATIYSDSAGTAKSNPFSATSAGFWHFYANDGDYDVLVSCGVAYSYTLSSLRVLSGFGSTSILSFGAICDGSTDDTTAIRAAIASSIAAQPTSIQLPAATCKFTDTITLSANRTRLIGPGSYTSNLLFVPASGGLSAFKAQHATASTVISNITFSGFRVYSTETSLQKIAFDIIDGSFITFDDIVVGPEDQWKGAGTSIGIKLRGRELINIRNSSIWANDGVALSIQPNPNDTRDGDYLVIENSNFSGDKTTSSTQPVIAALSNTQLTRSAFRDINVSYGGYAFYWVDGASATSSDSLSFSNFHWEQSRNASGVGELIRIDKTGSSKLYNFNCSRCGVGGAQVPNGVYLRNVEQAQIEQFFFPEASSAPFNISTTNGFTVRNTFLQSGSANVMTNMRKVKCLGRNTITAITTCTEELWESTSNTNLKESIALWDTFHYNETGTLAAGASVSLYMASGSLKTSRIEVIARGATLRAGGAAILDNAGAALLDTGILFDDADTGSNLCVIWTSSANATLKNNTAESLDYAYVQWFRR